MPSLDTLKPPEQAAAMPFDEAAAVAGAMAVTDAFLTTFNLGDAEGHSRTLAYPHIRLAAVARGRCAPWWLADRRCVRVDAKGVDGRIDDNKRRHDGGAVHNCTGTGGLVLE